MKMLTGDGISIELSKRRTVMPFWHRNMDFDEVIICVKGKATWKTEHGTYELNEGELLLIPRGVSHTAAATADSEYMAIEIKSKSQLTNVAEKRRTVMPFWHRNMDFDEVIICVKGKATWKTEHGTWNWSSSPGNLHRGRGIPGREAWTLQCCRLWQILGRLSAVSGNHWSICGKML